MEDKKLIRLSGIAYESLSNGPGIRRVLFSQGCSHNCKNCFNKSTHAYDGGRLEDMDKLIDDIKQNPMLKGVTFSGGDPLEQADKFAYIAKEVKAAGRNIWCYTGYTFEYILKHQHERSGWEALLKNVDVLVDGKFEEDKTDECIKFRGSYNQRIIDVQESMKTGEITVLDYDNSNLLQ